MLMRLLLAEVRIQVRFVGFTPTRDTESSKEYGVIC